MVKLQFPSVILPTVAPLGTETEVVADLVVHRSLEFDVSNLLAKAIRIITVEVVVAGIPGNLLCWVELSSFLTPTTPLYWTAIGGGGGFLPPVAPLVIVGTGVNLAAASFMLPWNIYSPYARLVIQTPVAAGLPNASWLVQAVFDGG